MKSIFVNTNLNVCVKTAIKHHERRWAVTICAACLALGLIEVNGNEHFLLNVMTSKALSTT